MTKEQEALASRAAPKLGQALAEHTLGREAQEPGDPEHRKYILKDVNNLLLAAGPGAELRPSQLSHPSQVQNQLKASMESPAQVLAKELPNRLGQWLDQEPPPDHPNRPQWAEQGRNLLNQVRGSSSNLR